MSGKEKVTALTLKDFKKNKEKIACMTAYDAAFGKVLDSVGIDVILVGDSVGMVVQGHETTVPVSVEDMIYHSKMVNRGVSRAMVMVDMPFMSYSTPTECLANAALLMKKGGAEFIKLEWGELEIDMVKRLTDCGIPVCAHLGLTPQSIHKYGGYRVQGREMEAAKKMQEDALLLVEAGADLLLLECVPVGLAKNITVESKVPVIGIGAGQEVDGQILVLYDAIDIAPGKRTRFSKNFMEQEGSIRGALEAYVKEVKSGIFPSKEYSFD